MYQLIYKKKKKKKKEIVKIPQKNSKLQNSRFENEIKSVRVRKINLVEISGFLREQAGRLSVSVSNRSVVVSVIN